MFSIALACNVISCNSCGDSSQTPEAAGINQTTGDPNTDQTPKVTGTDQKSENIGTENQRIAKKFNLQNAFPTLSFGRVTDIQNAGDGSGRLFIVQQEGVISVLNKETVTASTQASSSVFLDIKDRVFFDKGESGLLGLAFHPDYEKNGFLFVHYRAADPDLSVISRFSVDPDNPNTADPDSELKLLEIPQPDPIHNGGHIAFGPMDGYLYIPLGDGGPGGERAERVRT